jgi:dTDP-4-amino-4,6-dideoxy-D-galactose acyltransferase
MNIFNIDLLSNTPIKRLDWDSDFFGFEVGSCEINEQEIFDYNDFLKESGKYKLIYVFSDMDLECSSFKLVDRKITFQQELRHLEITERPTKSRIVSFDSNKHDMSQMINLALLSGVNSRFNIDSNFKNGEYEKLYTEWILKSINGDLAQDVLIFTQHDKILGFITLNLKSDLIAEIGLLAVAEQARGEGLGTELVLEAIHKARLTNRSHIQVVTQADNLPAMALYQKSKFNIIHKKNIYHHWKYDTV